MVAVTTLEVTWMRFAMNLVLVQDQTFVLVPAAAAALLDCQEMCQRSLLPLHQM